jgi:uncharacterized glyoxalase superfamily protein PhnB
MSKSISSSVDVATDPATAFKVFTEEMNCWWRQGPINFHDSSRAYENRIEPEVGGRLMEVYDRESGDGLELGRVTAWQPGVMLSWTSSIDDVSTVVSFNKSDVGTRVTVEATLADGGSDQGGTSWVRMTPLWYGNWIDARQRQARQPVKLSRLAVGVHYADPIAAAHWLKDVFNFDLSSSIPEPSTPDEHIWIEFSIGDSALMVFPVDGNAEVVSEKAVSEKAVSEKAVSEKAVPEKAVTHTPWVFVDDLDEHYAMVSNAGAIIIDEIWHHGVRAYKAADLEGNHWNFAQRSPVM